MTHCLLEASTLFWCESVGLRNDWDHIHLQRDRERERETERGRETEREGVGGLLLYVCTIHLQLLLLATPFARQQRERECWVHTARAW